MKERNTAIAAAQTQAKLVEVERADKWVWGENSIFWVVMGTMADGKQEYVWLKYNSDGTPAKGNNAVRTLPVEGTVTREQMQDRFAAELPEAKLIRMLPGVYLNQYTWQIFYEQNDTRYYRFYNLKDGSAVGQPSALPKW
nr:DUF5590 domain-containing protein [Saccharibacillus sp. JS10]